MTKISEGFKQRLSEPLKFTPLDSEEAIQNYLRQRREFMEKEYEIARESGINLPK